MKQFSIKNIGTFRQNKNIKFSNSSSICSSFASKTQSSPSTPANRRRTAFKVLDTKITNIVVSSDFTSLCDSCFKGCRNLKYVQLNDRIKFLPSYCFQFCDELISVVLPSELFKLGLYCFADCSNLKSINLHEKIVSLGSGCFHGCSSLQEIVIPLSVTSLPDYCFAYCLNLKSINLHEKIIALGSHCFRGCLSLQEIVIPLSITSLPDYCFAGCSNLKSIKLHENIKTLGFYCFACCSLLSSIFLPSSIHTVGGYCFFNCTSLRNVTILNMHLVLTCSVFQGSPIQRSPQIAVIEEMFDKSPFYQSSCPICREDFGPELKPFVLKQCQHVFCFQCISYLLSTTKKCALCNSQFPRIK